jgi:hypothetical protein
MLDRVVLVFAFFLQVSEVAAMDVRQTIAEQVHDSGICWDPDVEFPVPCDDDED